LPPAVGSCCTLVVTEGQATPSFKVTVSCAWVHTLGLLAGPLTGRVAVNTQVMAPPAATEFVGQSAVR